MPTTPAHQLVALLPRLRRYALTLCRSQSTADDLVQAACLRALAKETSFAPDTRFDAWVFKILHNLWIDMVRHARVEGAGENVFAQTGMVADRGEAAVLSRLTLRDVREAIDRLPPEHREVLLLVCVEDMTYREVAGVLGVPIGTVMSRLARARQRLVAITEPA